MSCNHHRDFVDMDLLSKRIKEIGVISIILIVAFSLGLLFYTQSITERDIKSNLLSQQKQRQIGSNPRYFTSCGFRFEFSCQYA